MEDEELAGAISSCAIDGLAILCKRASPGSSFATINNVELEDLSARILQGEASKSDFESPSSLGTIWASMVKVALSFNLPQYFQHPEDQDFSNIPVHYSRFIGALLSTFEILLDVLPAEIETLAQDLQHVFFPEDLAVSPTHDARIEDKMVQLVREYKDLFPYAYMFNRRSGKYPKSSVDVVNRYYKMRHSLMSSQSMTNSEEDFDYDYRHHVHDSPHSPHLGDEEEDSADRMSKYSGGAGGGDDDTLGDSFTPEHFPDLSTPGIAPLKPFNTSKSNVSSTSTVSNLLLNANSMNNNSYHHDDADLLLPGTEYAADTQTSGSSPGIDSKNRDREERIPYTPDGASILDAYYQTITTTNNNTMNNNNVIFNNNNIHNNNNNGFPHRMIIREEEDEDDSDDPEHPYHTHNNHHSGQKHVKRVTRMKRSLHNNNNTSNNGKMTRRRPSKDDLIASNTSANTNILASRNNNITNSNSLRLSTKTVTFAAKNEYQDYAHANETHYNNRNINEELNASVSLSQESDDALAILARDKELSSNNHDTKDNEVLMFDDVMSDEDDAIKSKPPYNNSNKDNNNHSNYRYKANTNKDIYEKSSSNNKNYIYMSNGHESDSSLELSDGGHNGGSNSNNSNNNKYNTNNDNVSNNITNRRYRNPLNATLEEEEFLSQKQQQSTSKSDIPRDNRKEVIPQPTSQLKLNRYDVDDVEDNDTLTSTFSNKSTISNNNTTNNTNNTWDSAKPVSTKNVLPTTAMMSSSLTVNDADTVQFSPVTSPQYQLDMRNRNVHPLSFDEKSNSINNNDNNIDINNNSPNKRKPFTYEVQYEEYLHRDVSGIKTKLRSQDKTYLVADEIDPALFAPPHTTVKDNLRKFKEQKMKQQPKQPPIEDKPKEKKKDTSPSDVFVPEFLTERRHYLLEQLQQPKENEYVSVTMVENHHKNNRDDNNDDNEEDDQSETVAESLKDVSDIRRSLELWRSHYHRPLEMLQEWETYWQQQAENKRNSTNNNDNKDTNNNVGKKSVSSSSVSTSQSHQSHSQNTQIMRSSSASSLSKVGSAAVPVNGSVNAAGGKGFHTEEEEELWQIQQLNAQYNVSGYNNVNNKGKNACKIDSAVGSGSVRSSSSSVQQQPFQDLPPVTAASQASVLPPLTELGRETGVILEGYLLKKSTKNFINRWKKRYFVLRESTVSFCELCIYGEAVDSAWGHIPLSLKAVIPLCDVAAVEAVGGKNTASAPLTLHLKFQPFHDDPPTSINDNKKKKQGMLSRLFSSSSQDNNNIHNNDTTNKQDAMRRSTGNAERLGAKFNTHSNNNNTNNNALLPPTVPKRTQSMRLSSTQNYNNTSNNNNVDNNITFLRSLSASSGQWEVGSTHSFASSDSENNNINDSKKSKSELQAMGYYGKVVKEMYLQTDSPEMRLLWVTTLSKVAQFVREAELAVLQQEKEEQEHQYLSLQQQQQQQQQE